jgi:hypothetical protein
MAKLLGLIKNPEYKKMPTLLSKAFIEGIRIGRTKRWQTAKIDIYKAPVLKVEFASALLKMINPKK